MPPDAPPPPEVLAHAAFVRRLAFHLLRDDADADDAAQETLTRALERPPRGGPGVRSWLATVLRNVVRRRRRDAARLERRERTVASAESVGATDDAVARTEIFDAVTDAVKALDPVHQEVVLARHYEGLAPRDVAARLGVPVATIKSRLARAHATLRARLDEGDRGNVGHWRAGLMALVGLGSLEATASAGRTAVRKGAIAMGSGAKSAVVGAAVLLAAFAFWRFGGVDPEGSSGSEAPRERGRAEQAHATGGPAPDPGATLAPAPSRAPPPGAAIGGPTITGRVVDGKGNGVAHARVVAASDVTRKPFSIEEIGTGETTAFRATSDDEGRFVVEVDGTVDFHTVFADAPGFALTARSPVRSGIAVTIPLEPASAIAGTVASVEGAPIVGARVKAMWLVDTMTVVREAVSGEGGAYRIDDLADPSFEAHPERPYGVIGYVEARAEGFAPLLVVDAGSSSKAAARRIDLTMSPGGRVVGRVLRAEGGAPIEGATVVVCSNEGRMGMERRNGVVIQNPFAPRPLAETVTAADGTFTLEHVPSRTSAPRRASNMPPTLAAWKPGFAPAAESVTILTDGSEARVDLALWPAAAIIGRVREADGSTPRTAHVGTTVEGRTSKTGVPTLYAACPRSDAPSIDAEGRFRIPAAPASDLGPTDVVVTVWAPSPPDAKRPDPAGPSTHATVRVGETVDVGEIVLGAVTRSPTIPVHVRAADGAPVVGASVGSAGNRMRTRADVHGVARLAWTSPTQGVPRRDVPMTVLADGFAPTPWTLSVPPPDLEPVTVVMLPAHRLEGRVLVPAGESLAGIQVVVGDGSVPVDLAFPPREIVLPTGNVPRGRSLPVLYDGVGLDAEGRFAFHGLPDGPYHVAATRQRRIPTIEAGTWITTVVSGVKADATDLVIRFPADDSPPVGSIEGRAIDRSSGKRLRDPTVVVSKDGRDVARLSTDGDLFGPQRPGAGGIDTTGRFTLNGLAVGRCRIAVRAGGHRTAWIEDVEIRDGETTVLPPVALDAGATIVGRVRGPQRAVWKGRRVRFVRRDTGAGATATPIDVGLEEDGTLHATGFEAGTYDVTSPILSSSPEAVAYLPAAGETLVVGSGDAEARFEATLVEAGTVLLQLTDARLPLAPWDAKGPVPEVEARFGAATRLTLRGPSGGASFDRTGVVRHGMAPDTSVTVLPGRYVARLDFPDATSVEETIEVAARDRLVVKLGAR